MESPQNKTTVTYQLEVLSNFSRFEITLLPRDYVPDPDLQPLRGNITNGTCGERFNMMDPKQTHSEKIPRVPVYDKIECAMFCQPEDYLVEMYPVNATAIPYRDFWFNKPCTKTCRGRQAGWSC